MNNIDLSLYLVTDKNLTFLPNQYETIEEAVKGGVTVVQLREKNLSTKQFVEEAIKIKNILQKYNVPLVINDRLDVCLACDADGIHIGQDDMPYEIARKLLPKGKIIGLSVETFEQADEANSLDVDYIAISPVFSTPTKTDTKQPFGIEGIRKVRQISKHKIVSIGGINLSNAEEIIKAGSDGIAVVSAIVSNYEPQNAAKELLLKVKNSLNT